MISSIEREARVAAHTSQDSIADGQRIIARGRTAPYFL